MQNGLYVALSSQIALENRLNTIADNVANANTVGFRATGVKFEDLVYGTGEKAMDFVTQGNTYLSTETGPLRQTENPYDFAIRGDGWFGISTPAGTIMTRDGRFTMLETGALVTVDGYPVLDAGGAAIVLDPREGAPTAGADGTLRQNGQLMGAIGLFDFDPGPNFTRYGNSGVVPDTPPQPLVDRPDVGVVQGFVEASNVNPVKEMTRLIMVQRAFDNAAALIRESEASYSDAIKTLGSR
jgi:flagellar basal-body rod protein FlgF